MVNLGLHLCIAAASVKSGSNPCKPAIGSHLVWGVDGILLHIDNNGSVAFSPMCRLCRMPMGT